MKYTKVVYKDEKKPNSHCNHILKERDDGYYRRLRYKMGVYLDIQAEQLYTNDELHGLVMRIMSLEFESIENNLITRLGADMELLVLGPKESI